MPRRSRRRARLSSIRAARTNSSSRASCQRAGRAESTCVGKCASSRALRICAGGAETAENSAERPSSAPRDERAPEAGGNVGRAVVDADDPSRVDRVRLVSFLQELRLGVLDPHLAPGRGHGRAVQRGPAPFQGLGEGRVPVVPDDAHGAAAVVGHGLDAQQPPPHPRRPDTLEAHETRRWCAPRQAGERREVPAVLVPERNGEEQIGDRVDSGGRQARRPRRPHARQARDRVAQGQRPAGARGAGRQVAGAWKVSGTRPNFRTSPLPTATGTPVASRVPLT